MGEEDLLAMLGLDGALPEAGAAGEVLGESLEIGAHGARPAGPPPSPYAIEQDAWGMRRGRDLVAEDGALAGAGVTAEAAADFHAAAYEQAPALLPEGRCEDALRRDYLADLMQTEEYRNLAASTVLNPTTSEMAALHYSRGYAELVKERAEDEAEGEAGDTARDKMRRDLRRKRAAAGAAREASKEVGDFNDAAEAFGIGGGGGDENGKMDAARAAAVYKKIRENMTLRKIVEAAGVYRRLARGRRRRKARHGQDEVVGVSLGGDIARLVPSELAALSGFDELLELDALRRVSEQTAMVRELRASEPVGKGPVVVVVDESGSMSGDPIERAKGLALAIAWVARKQRRWVGLVGFSGGTDGTLCVLPPGRWDEAALIGWLTHFYGGGTVLDVPLDVLPFAMWPKLLEAGAVRGKTDIIIITDAQVNAPEEMTDKFSAWRKAERCRVTSLVIGADPGDLARVSDSCHTVRGIDESEEVAATLDI